jgi:hypothetical protein
LPGIGSAWTLATDGPSHQYIHYEEDKDMKRLLLIAAGLCTTAALMAPIASASGVTVTGKCELKGPATFNPPIKLTPALAGGYTFESTEVKCETTPATSAGSAKVAGSGVLSCSASTSGTTPGTGEIKYTEAGTVVTDTIEKFVFVGTGNVVNFVATGPNVKAAGVAHFEPGAAQKCVEGAATLPFEAVITPGSEI